MNTVAAGSAFVAGLLSSGHCFGMCGGIVGAFSLGNRGTAGTPGPGDRGRIQGLVAYNAGRIVTYCLLGGVAGTFGATLAGALPPEMARRGARLLAALFLLGLGLYLAGRPELLQPFERLGGRLWRRIEPLSRRLLAARGPGHALALGLVWGFLPCGMVYSMLVLASLGGSTIDGALVMLAFGLGTLPALFAAGLAASRLRGLARSTLLRRSAAAVYLALGIWLAFTAFTAVHHDPSGAATGGVGGDTCPPRAAAL